MKYLLTRQEIVVAIAGHIFEEMDGYEVATLFEKATGVAIEPADFDPEVGDAWRSEVPFRKFVRGGMAKILAAVKEASEGTVIVE
jgi:hypothetical protein